MTGLVGGIAGGQILPGGAGAHDPENAVQDIARIPPRSTSAIAPHRRNRRRPRQDARPLRRYCRRWKIERLFAWLQNFRRIVTRYEYHAANYLGFIQLGCVIILLRHL